MKRQSWIERGFTLIELLIVVAIIAILAAIAVPNFLEAQTRSKISRVKADQRTIATALEAYFVDTNNYPEQAVTTLAAYPWENDPRKVYGSEAESGRHDAGNPGIAFRLSTPVAYVTSTTEVFSDPFFKGFNLLQTSVVNDTRYYNYSGNYNGGRVYDTTQDPPVLADFQTLSKTLADENHWHLRSRGPDGGYSRRANGWADFLLFKGRPGTGLIGDGGLQAVYDPTNGTVSSGDVVRLGNGIIKP